MKKNILILGSNGMLGHTLSLYLSNEKNFVCYNLARQNKLKSKKFIKFTFNTLNFNLFEKKIKNLKLDYVINCVGIIKQKQNRVNYNNILFINSILPNKLSKLANKLNFKLLHISTDCVFNGKKGNYTEKDIKNAQDLYGRSKSLGELENNNNSYTIRTSIIGDEISRQKTGLLEWFLKQKNQINGFSNAYFNGFTTLELSKIILNYFIKKQYLPFGIYNLSSKKISKYNLLIIIKKIYNKNIKIINFKKFKIDRSLSSSKFKSLTGYVPPTWTKMIKEFYNYSTVKNDN